jgi:hypothetical protein
LAAASRFVLERGRIRVTPDLADRVQRTRLLLETLEDPYPRPRSALRPDSGPAASRYVPCEHCRRSGWVRRRRGPALLCLICDGRGWRRREHGDLEWDAYLLLPVREAVQLPTAPPARPREQPDGLEPGFSWERLREAYDRSGSYAEARQRLAELTVERPRRGRLVRLIVVEAQPYELRAADRREVDLGVLGITLRMRSVRVPPWLLEHGQAQANETVRGLAAQGYKPAQIAARMGVSIEQVKRALRRSKQRGKRAQIGVGFSASGWPAGAGT